MNPNERPAHLARRAGSIEGTLRQRSTALARWQRCTRKNGGAIVKFGEYSTHGEAADVAARLVGVSENAQVVEVVS
jgi:hypothetical protein